MQLHSSVPGDLPRMVDLLTSYRAAGYGTRYPTVWRFKLLFASQVWNTQRDVQLWDDDQGKLIACALLWKRRANQRYFALERVIHPETVGSSVQNSMLDWAITRTLEESATQQAAITLTTTPQERFSEEDARLLTGRGFVRSTEGHNVYLAQPLVGPFMPTSVASGFDVRPLTEEDLPRYRAASGFTEVAIEHQREQIRDPEYHQLVINAPDGTLAAYLECSFHRDEWADNQQRVGWIDYVETRPEFLRMGLGRALISRGLEHLRTSGSNRAMLITRHDNVPAHALFTSVGMVFVHKEFVHTKEIDARQNQHTDDPA